MTGILENVFNTGEWPWSPSSTLDAPLHWKTPRKVFVNEDLFDNALSYEQIAVRFGVMAAAPHLTFQCVTRLPLRARDFNHWLDSKALQWEGASPCDWRVHAVSQYAFEATRFEGDCGPLPEQWPLPNVEIFYLWAGHLT